MDYKILASNISSLRVEKKWSQSDLAGFLNISRQAVSKWETGQSVPDIDSLLLLSKLFSNSINDLLERHICQGINSIEEILKVQEVIVEKVLGNFEVLDIMKAAKGLSPAVLEYMCSLDGFDELREQAQALGPVRLSEVESIHKRIVDGINSEMIIY